MVDSLSELQSIAVYLTVASLPFRYKVIDILLPRSAYALRVRRAAIKCARDRSSTLSASAARSDLAVSGEQISADGLAPGDVIRFASGATPVRAVNRIKLAKIRAIANLVISWICRIFAVKTGAMDSRRLGFTAVEIA